MRVLLLAHSFNSLTQRLWVELSERGHEVTLELDVNDAVTLEAAALARPDIVVAPFLKRALPEGLWRATPCLVVHPGPPGDRGPAALDWAILEGRSQWGVTVLQAEAEMDAGPVWASRTFPLRPDATKSAVYRIEVTEAAVTAVIEALDRFALSPHPPEAPRPPEAATRPDLAPIRPMPPRARRAIDWRADDTATVLRKIRSADGHPGVADLWDGRPLRLFQAEAAVGLAGEPGTLLARDPATGAVARATRDGAVWIGILKDDAPDALKLPAIRVLGAPALALPQADGPADIVYEEDGPVGHLHFPVHNGALSTGQCRRLTEAFRRAAARPTRVIVLRGGPHSWCNGIHLGTIEAADSPADESWVNIAAMDDLCEAVLTCRTHLTVAALAGNGGAGGVFMALAADRVVARSGVVLNPHYKGMGNLYGSEYWTYLLPRRCGEDNARAITQARLPMGCAEALRLGLIDRHFGATPEDFDRELRDLAQHWARDPDLTATLAQRNHRRDQDEAIKPLAAYRAEELAHMRLNFYGFDPSYHVARWSFIHKIAKSRTPLTLARHRDKRPVGD